MIKYNGSLNTQWTNITLYGIDEKGYYHEYIALLQPTKDTDVHALVYVIAMVLFYDGVLLIFVVM